MVIFNNKEKLILLFLNDWQRPIRPGDMANELHIKHTTLNSVLHKLKEKAVITWEKYGTVSLTKKGLRHSNHFRRHHHLFALFLSKTLELEVEESHQQVTIAFTSNLPCKLIEKVDEKLNYPQICNCNTPIPGKKSKIEVEGDVLGA